jgi:Integrase core domain
LKTPFRSPQANTYCERLIGSLRRECLDFLMPLSESHLRRMVKEWQIHYNQARPHSSLGPGAPRAEAKPSGATARATTPNSGGISSESQADSGWSTSRVSPGEDRRLRLERKSVRRRPAFTRPEVSSGAAARGIDESDRSTLSAFRVARGREHCPIGLPRFFCVRHLFPSKPPGQQQETQPGSSSCSLRFDLTFLKSRQLLAQKEILSTQSHSGLQSDSQEFKGIQKELLTGRTNLGDTALEHEPKSLTIHLAIQVVNGIWTEFLRSTISMTR